MADPTNPRAEYVSFPAVDTNFWRTVNAIWPDLNKGRAAIAPARNGMDAKTGKLLHGWPHVEQSMRIMFTTPFHVRVIRRWVGTFVPQILGEDVVPRMVTRFFWAIATAVELWEPNYRIKQVHFMGDALKTDWNPATTLGAAELLRLGEAIFRTEGVYRPRAHLGDFTPYERRYSALTGAGGEYFDVVPIP